MNYLDCRRTGIERRVFNYDAYYPERRINDERRIGRDRRTGDENIEIGLKRRESDN